MRDELRALVNAYGLWIADLRASLFQSLYDVLRFVAESGVDDGREACERVKNRQDPELKACRQLIVDTVHGPRFIRLCCFFSIFS